MFPEVKNFSFRCYHHLGLELDRHRQGTAASELLQLLTNSQSLLKKDVLN